MNKILNYRPNHARRKFSPAPLTAQSVALLVMNGVVRKTDPVHPLPATDVPIRRLEVPLKNHALASGLSWRWIGRLLAQLRLGSRPRPTQDGRR
jgi:hypothetical protein